MARVLKATNIRSIMRAELGGVPSVTMSNRGDERPMQRQLVDRFGMWVHRCVMGNAELAASIPIKLLSRGAGLTQKVYGAKPKALTKEFKGFLQGRASVRPGSFVRKALRNIEDYTELQEHPLLDLLHKVNAWTDGYQYRVSLYADRQIFGRAFTHLVGGEQPVEMWRMEPFLVKILPSVRQFVSGYEYGEGANKTTLSTDEVLWFRIYDPADSWGGVGPVEAWLKTIDAAFAIQEFQQWLFLRGGTPDYWVLTEAETTEPQRRAWRAEFRNFFGLLHRRKENIAFLSGTPKPEVVKANESPRELEFSASEDKKRDMIAAALGYPKSKLTTDNVNRANARETDEVHIRDTIWSMIQQVEDMLNQRLVPRFGDGLLLCHDNPIPEDKTIRIQERASQLGSGYTVNQILEADGEEGIGPDGDEPLIATGLTTLDRVINPPEPMLELGDEADGEEAQEQPQEPQDNEEAEKAFAAIVRKELEPLAARVASMQAPPTADQIGAMVTKQVTEAMQPLGAKLQTLQPPTAEQLGESVNKAVSAAVAPLAVRLEALEHHESDPAVTMKGLLDQVRSALEPILVRVKDLPPLEVKAEAAVLSLSHLWDQYYAGNLNGEVACCKAHDPATPKKVPALLTTRLRRVFRDQLRAVSKAIEELGLAEGSRVAADVKWQEQLAETLKPAMDLYIERGGKAAAGKLPKGLDFDVQNPAVQEFVDRYTVRLATQVAGSTEVALSRLFDERLAKGASTVELAQAVKELDSAISPYRAEMIARTESARAYVAGETQGWRMSGQVVAKEWLLAPNACEYCQAVSKEWEGRSTGLDDAFYPVGHVLTGVEGGRMKLDYETVQGPPLHPHCLLPGSTVSAIRPVAALSAEYEGTAVTVVTAGGRSLSVTANHQFLTDHGFVAAQALRKGDHVVCRSREKGMIGGYLDDDELVSGSADVVSAFAKAGGMTTAAVPTSHEHLHGDGGDVHGYINVVASDRFLWSAFGAALGQEPSKLPLGLRHAAKNFDSPSDLAPVLLRLSAAAHGVVCRFREPHSLGLAEPRHTHMHGGAAATDTNTALLEAPAQCQAVNPASLGECLHGAAGLIELDEVIQVCRHDFVGHVTDLQTWSGLYTANGIIVGNCRCDLLPVLEGE